MCERGLNVEYAIILNSGTLIDFSVNWETFLLHILPEQSSIVLQESH